MNPHLWLAYAFLELGASLTPGPAVLTVVAQGVKHGAARSLYGNLGILVANLIYFALLASGVAALIAASLPLYAALRWGGIAYLAFTGITLLRRSRMPPVQAVDATASSDAGAQALFVQGLTTHLGNPKAIVFYTSIFAPFLDSTARWPLPAQIVVYAGTTVLIEVPVLALYGWTAARTTRLLPARAAGVWQNRFAGLALVLVAAWLAFR